jgi:hypothetical protein
VGKLIVIQAKIGSLSGEITQEMVRSDWIESVLNIFQTFCSFIKDREVVLTNE